MKIRITTDIDRLIVYFTFLEVLILRWVLIGQDTLMGLFTAFLILRLLYAGIGSGLRFKNGCFLIIITIFIFLNSIFQASFEWRILLKNINFLIQPAAVIAYYGYLNSRRRHVLFDCFFSLRRILNIYYYINFVIILLQKDETYFLMPISRIYIDYYPDNMAGLLGLGGTHRLALVTVFTILLNTWYVLNYTKIGSKRRRYGYYNIGLIILSTLYTSAMNDNNAVYVLIPFCMVLYFVHNYSISKKNLLKIAIFAISSVMAFAFICNNGMTSVRIFSIVKNAIQTFLGGEITDERFVYLDYALREKSGLKLGVGFGSILMQMEPTITSLGYHFRNWGMADISPLVAMGGVWFYLFLLWAYVRTLYTDYALRKKRKYIAFLLLILTYYQQVFTNITLAIPMCWIIVLMSLSKNE